ncbi:MAG: DNA polymerase [Saprospiraceae bacterium]|nr:DNA polymerase [Saprospiraceae bacterium]
MPKKFAVIDCETDPFSAGRIPEPFIWGYYAPDDGFLHFNHVNDLFEFLKGQDVRLYAHNGGKFDFHYMLDKIPSWEKVIMINGRLAQFRIEKLEFCDSYCILPVPLSAYQKTKIDYNIFEKENRHKPGNMEKITAYLKDDCVFLYELIDEFLSENGFSLTIASSAIKKLQAIEGIKVEDSGREFFNEIKPYYFGGRVECFKKGIINEEVQYFDINSAYPYAMKHEHPIGGFITTYEKEPEIKGHNFYKFQAESSGAFPFRNDDKSLIFPADKNNRIFCCTGWELIAARETNQLRKVIHIEQKVFLETCNFSKYVDYYYTIKATSAKGSPENIFAKLYLNSAYGKFAADPEKYKTTYLCPLEDFDNALSQGYSIHGELHDRLIISKSNDESEWRHYNVATGASITGFVRAFLFRSLQKVEKPIYCDTDSIIFSGKHSLQMGENLGEWKNEGLFHTGGIGGKKIYAFRNNAYDKISTSDLSENAEKLRKKYQKLACKGLILNYDEIISVCKGNTISKTPDNPIYSIKRGKYFLKKTIAMT